MEEVSLTSENLFRVTPKERGVSVSLCWPKGNLFIGRGEYYELDLKQRGTEKKKNTLSVISFVYFVGRFHNTLEGRRPSCLPLHDNEGKNTYSVGLPSRTSSPGAGTTLSDLRRLGVEHQIKGRSRWRR